MKMTKRALGAGLAVALTLGVSAGNVFAADSQMQMKPTTSTPAVDLRVTLDRLLGEHAELAIIAMQKGLDGAPDFGAAAAALGQNTDDLTAAIQSVYGDAAAKKFHDIWSNHIGFFVDYVTATAKNDEAGKKAALDKLAQYKKDFSEFLASANPNLKADALATGLQMHVNQLVKAFDAYHNKDYTTAYSTMREAYSHMFGTGDALAGAISWQFPSKFNNTSTNTPAADLRVTLDRLLGEHAELAVFAMQKGLTGAPDFNAIAAALGQNTDDLTAAIKSVYGDAAANKFHDIWSNHIGFFVNYVVATAKHDDAGRKAALDKLSQYKKDFSEFLASANPNLQADALASGLQMHVDQLVGAFDSYNNKDYTTAYKDIRVAYAHMYGTGDALSGAIVTQFPEKFQTQMPTDMPKTGMGGTSSNGSSPLTETAGWLALLGLAAAGTGFYVRKKRMN